MSDITTHPDQETISVGTVTLQPYVMDVLIYPLHLRGATDDVQVLNTEFNLRQICIDLSAGPQELQQSCIKLVDDIVACATVSIGKG